MIGIVGGIGPLAGIDLYKRIITHTKAVVDQDHLPVLLASLPGEIVDRTTFLLGGIEENPAFGLAKVILLLENAGAKLIAIACNTAHAPAIFDPMLRFLKAKGSTAEIIHLIDITLAAIIAQQEVQNIGILSTSGAYKTRLYQNSLEAVGLTPILLPYERHNELVHTAIYEIKTAGEVVNNQVIVQLNTAIQELETMGAQAVILGCTEIGMIENLLDFRGLAVFNPNTIIAKALILKHSPGRLLTIDC
jgi:aspartate racemase